MMLRSYEAPVAYAMIELATSRRPDEPHPLEMFTLYWVAFNSIYVTVAELDGFRARPSTTRQGVMRVHSVGGVSVPKMILAPERQQIDCAFKRFGADLRRDLVDHPSTPFFVNRTPEFRGEPVVVDEDGQRLNGVLNVGHTLDAANPVWAPINAKLFGEYQAGARTDQSRDVLANEILWVLYAVRNNTFHGSKNPDDGNDREVLEKAVPLIQLVVESFLER